MKQRTYEKSIERHFSGQRQMLFLMGPRQVGKTTTARTVGEGRESTYLNWDNLDHRQTILGGPPALAQALEVDRLGDEPPLLILDEVHKLAEWRQLLKGFFDTHGDRSDVLVTGSARLSVFNSGGESLMGRYFGYRMHPLSVAELVAAAGSGSPGDRRPRKIEDDAFDALLRFGGFPEPLTRMDSRFANRWQRHRRDQLFQQEIRDLTRIQELAKVEMLAELIRRQVASLTQLSSLANRIDASIDSVKRWLATLEHLYYCFAVRPWFRNVARALRKEPKFFLWDWSMVVDPGARFENLIASALLKAAHFWTDEGYGEFALHFVRDKDKREVDFLVVRDEQPWLLVEAKRSASASLSHSLRHHADQLNVEYAFQVVEDAPFVERDVFALERPTIVPARTLLSQLI